MLFKEELLHFIWQFRLYQSLDLFSADGEKIRVVGVGQHNKNAGPDFLYSKIQIGLAEWVGHVEIHLTGQDWYQHQHDSDPAYNNVILHVIWENLIPCRRADGTEIPTLILSHYVDANVLVNYSELISSKRWIPCAKQLPEVDGLLKLNLLQRMSIERLELKFDAVQEYLASHQSDWEKAAFMLLCRSFGMKVNAEAFLKLAELIDIKLFQKFRADKVKIEALCFGQAGFLEEDEGDDYYLSLQLTYRHLKAVYHFNQMNAEEWKFLRMRPYNFPTYRIAQLCCFYAEFPSFFSKIIEMDAATNFTAFFKPFTMHVYWENHFRFSKTTNRHSTNWSPAFIEHLVINCFSVLVFSYGKYSDNPMFIEKAIRWLSDLKPEKNSITEKFKELGLQAKNASDSQALLHLYARYCEKKNCLDCSIGLSILKRKI
ncbi:DUF2851 family protein [Sphingobacterium hungaricum]